MPPGVFICTTFTLMQTIVSVNGCYTHIGVGSDVVCSTIIGNARASVRGMDSSTIPRFFYVGTKGTNLDGRIYCPKPVP